MLTKIEDLSIEERLISAKISLLMKLPFFGNIASRLTLKEVDWVPVAATDGVNFFYNPKGVEKYSISNLVWLFGHEVLHVCLQHFMRMDERILLPWNIATDYAINSLLFRNKVGSPIEGSLHDKKFDEKSSEEIYEFLKKQSQKDLDQMAQGIIDTHMDMGKNPDGSPKSQEEIDKLKLDIKKSIIEATQNCEAGNTPLGLERLINSITKPQLPWQQILEQSIKSKVFNDFTFSRPNRRNIEDFDFILPSMSVEDDIDICIAMDMSGSIGQDVASKFMSEISGIISDFKSWKIKIWSFDTKVYNVEDYSSMDNPDILKYVPKGGGGTYFECNWDYMESNNINPKVFIMFTDLYPCSGWGNDLYCDTIFVGYGNNKIVAPFGETIYLD